MKRNIKKAFTFVELIVVITILTILWTIWFTSYIDSIWDSRDSQRKADILKLSSWLAIYEQKNWQYPYPWNYFEITYSGSVVAYQWYFDNNVHISTFDNNPKDPKTKWAYIISTNKNRLEFEVAGTLENWEKPTAILQWKYKSVSKNILPRITLAKKWVHWDSFEIKDWLWDWSTNRLLFVYNNQRHNLVYDFNEPYLPYSDWTKTFEELLAEVEEAWDFSQNNDYRNCVEIEEGWKLLLPLTTTEFEYQILTETWALTNTGCTE